MLGNFVSVPKFRVGTLALMLRDVVQGERLQALIRQTQIGGLGAGAIDLPLVDEYALDQPECGSSISAGAVNERRFVSFFGNRFQKLIHHGWIRRRSIERQTKELDTCGLGGGRFG